MLIHCRSWELAHLLRQKIGYHRFQLRLRTDDEHQISFDLGNVRVRLICAHGVTLTFLGDDA